MLDPLLFRLLFVFIVAHATKRNTEGEKALLPLFTSEANNSSRMGIRTTDRWMNGSIYTCLSTGQGDSELLFVPCISSEECLQKFDEIQINANITASTSADGLNYTKPETPRTWCVNQTGILVYKAKNSDLYDFRAVGPPLNVITANNTELINPQYQLPQGGDMLARIVAKKYFVNQSTGVTCMASKFIYSSNPKISVLYRNGTSMTAMDVVVDSDSRNVTASVKFDSTEVIGIECSAHRWDNNENDSYQYPLSVSDPIPFEVISQSQSPIYLEGNEENVAIACSIKGAPSPKIVWKKNGQLPYATPFIQHFENGVNTSLTFLMAASRNSGASPQTNLTYNMTYFSSPQEITGEYILYITNDGNKPACRIKIEMENPTATRPSIASFVAVLSTSALVVLMVLLVMKIKFHKSFFPLTKVLSRISRTSSENSENFKDEPSDVTIEIGDEELRISETPEKVGTVGNLITSCAYLSLLETEEEFDVVPESALTIGSCIGCGFSGNVYRGRFYSKDVAIKRMANNGCQWLQAVTRELSILASIGRHPNVIELVTALRVDCGFYGSLGDIAIITEFCENGDLKTYLSKRRNSFRNEIQEDEIVISECCDPIHHNNSADSRYVAVLADFVSTTDLILWAIQFARGMDFLASENVVHGDVALRNLLLDGNRTLKVSDFGLSKRLHGDSEYYKMKSDERIPWANCAPEFLETYKASTNTDIWGFGVALWEMFTLGQVPYLGEFDSCTRTFRTALKEGHKLCKPIYATTAIYKLMTSCWNITPKLRPSFKDLTKSLERQCPPTALSTQVFTDDRALDLPVAYSRIEPIDFGGH